MMVLIVLVAACGDTRRAGDGVVTRDSAGVRIIENGAPQWGDGETWTVDPTPVLEIGTVDGPEEYALDFVVTVTRTASGEIVVAQQTEVRIYDAEGNHLRTFGAAGSGPGEFQRIAKAVVCEGRIVADDLMTPRLTLFTFGGTLDTMIPLPAGTMITRVRLIDCVARGPLMRAGATGGGGDSGPPRVRRDTSALAVLDPAKATLDTMGALAGPEGFNGLVVPFGTRAFLTATDSMLYIMDNGQPEIRVLGLDGNLRRIIRLAIEPTPVTAADVERRRAEYLTGVPPSLAEAEIIPRLDAVPWPETKPFFSGLEVATDGTVWLKSYYPWEDGEDTRWTVVSAEGAWLGDVTLPSRFTPHAFGEDDVIGIWRDENDVQFVRVHRFLRPR